MNRNKVRNLLNNNFGKIVIFLDFGHFLPIFAHKRNLNKTKNQCLGSEFFSQ